MYIYRLSVCSNLVAFWCTQRNADSRCSFVALRRLCCVFLSCLWWFNRLAIFFFLFLTCTFIHNIGAPLARWRMKGRLLTFWRRTEVSSPLLCCVVRCCCVVLCCAVPCCGMLCCVLCCVVLCYLALPCLVLSCLVLSCLVLSCLVLSCLVLSCRLLSPFPPFFEPLFSGIFRPCFQGVVDLLPILSTLQALGETGLKNQVWAFRFELKRMISEWLRIRG